MSSKGIVTLKERVAEMQSPELGHKYYAITLTATKGGKINWAAQSVFSGMTNDSPPRELRVACEIIPNNMLTLWRDVGQPWVVVNNEHDFHVYLIIGGNALIASDIVKHKLPFLLESIPVVPNGLCGTLPLSQVPSDELQRAPTPKKRMAVLKRDNYRCQICGRRAADHIDVELNLHHVRPWKQGGLTSEKNLITLCRTCHKGLDPHFDFKLFELSSLLGSWTPSVEGMREELFQGIKNYRNLVIAILKKKNKEVSPVPRSSAQKNKNCRRGLIVGTKKK